MSKFVNPTNQKHVVVGCYLLAIISLVLICLSVSRSFTTDFYTDIARTNLPLNSVYAFEVNESESKTYVITGNFSELDIWPGLNKMAILQIDSVDVSAIQNKLKDSITCQINQCEDDKVDVVILDKEESVSGFNAEVAALLLADILLKAPLRMLSLLLIFFLIFKSITLVTPADTVLVKNVKSLIFVASVALIVTFSNHYIVDYILGHQSQEYAGQPLSAYFK